MSEKKIQSILVVRPDRIGDVILSTPVLKTLRKKFPTARITFFIQEFLSPILSGLSCVDEFIYFDPMNAKKNSWKYFRELTSLFKQKKFDVVINLQSQTLIAASEWAAGIPVRIGPLSKPHSYLFYNHGVKQKRSQVLLHEAEYNLDLLLGLGLTHNDFVSETEIVVPLQSQEKINEKMKKRCPQALHEKIILIHPGMRGSALNWPMESYLKLAHSFLLKNRTVFITAGENEQWVLDYFKKGNAEINFNSYLEKKLYLWGGTEAPLTLAELAALMERVSGVVAPSTGPLHMAVALRKKSISFYPNTLVQSQKRWGPFVLNPQEKKNHWVYTPHPGNNKMNEILVEDVLHRVKTESWLE